MTTNSTRRWDEDRIQRAEALLVGNASVASVAEILSQEWGEEVTRDALKNALQRYREQGGSSPIFQRPLSIKHQSITVIADLHAPFQDDEYIDTMLQISEAAGTEACVLAGDLWEFNHLVSPDKQVTAATTLQHDLPTGKRILHRLLEYFRTIYITNSNHDGRIARRLGANYTLRNLFHTAMEDNLERLGIVTTEYWYLVARFASGSDWKIGHLNTYSPQPGELARRIAEKEQINVAVGHDHIQGFRSTLDGKYMGISIGSMIEVDQFGKSGLWYKEKMLEPSYQPVRNGFLILQDGAPYLFNREGASALNGGGSFQTWLDLIRNQ